MSCFKIFLSSTAYDLGTERTILKEWIETLGHEVTLSDYGDICYDPREHTHMSCIKAVKNHDALVVLVGSRFGGEAIPKVHDTLNIDYLIKQSRNKDFLKDDFKISITQAEVLMAIEYEIPIYVLVDKKVSQEQLNYSINKNKNGLGFATRIKYSSIDKPETAEYIFEFIIYLAKREINNAYWTYENINDIKTYLSKQWSKHFHNLLVEEKDKTSLGRNVTNICVNDKLRNSILNTFKPNTYIPLKDNYCDLVTHSNCETSIYPNMVVMGDYVERIAFSEKGYVFNGKNMLSMHFKEDLPCESEERSFTFALNPTQFPIDNKPMFFFSYGQRRTHERADGINNHDKSFGLYFGEPSPEDSDDEVPNDYKGKGIRIFFYCEKFKEDRNSINCDTKVIDTMDNLNEWYIFALTYSAKNELKLYLNSKLIFNEKHILKTSKTPYLNLGGFVHHNKDGAMIAKDLDYTLKGNLREFMIFKNRCLSEEEVRQLTESINKLIV